MAKYQTLKEAEAKWASSKASVVGMELVERYHLLNQHAELTPTIRDIIEHITQDCLRNSERFSNDEILLRLALLEVFSNSNQIDATVERMATEKKSAIFECDPSLENDFGIMLTLDVPGLCEEIRSSCQETRSRYEKLLRSIYNNSSGDKDPQPWEYDSDLFPHDRGLTDENLRQKLENAYRDCRNYVAIALPSLFLDRTFHVIHFVVLKGLPFVIKYDACYPESHNDPYYPPLLKAEALRWSQALPVNSPKSGPSMFLGIRLIHRDASHSVSQVFVHQTQGDEPKTIDEWNDLVIHATTDPVEGKEISGYVNHKTWTTACAMCFGPWRGRDCLNCGLAIQFGGEVYSHPCLNLPSKIRRSIENSKDEVLTGSKRNG